MLLVYLSTENGHVLYIILMLVVEELKIILRIVLSMNLVLVNIVTTILVLVLVAPVVRISCLLYMHNMLRQFINMYSGDCIMQNVSVTKQTSVLVMKKY